MKQWRRLAAVGCVMLACIISSSGWALPGWLTSYKAGLAQAKREGRPLVIDFASATCPACRMLESRTLSDARVQAELDNFVRVYIDGNEQVSLRESFGVQYYPTVVYLSPDGKILKRHVGFVGPDEMTHVLRSIASRVPNAQLEQARADAGGGTKATQSLPAGAKSSARTSSKLSDNFYETVAAEGAKQNAPAKPTVVAVAPAVRTDQKTRVEWVAAGADAGEASRGGGEEKLLAQALPAPKNVETPAPLVHIKPESTPEAPKAPTTHTPAATAAAESKSVLPDSVKKLQSPSIKKGEETDAKKSAKSTPVAQSSSAALSEAAPAMPVASPAASKSTAKNTAAKLQRGEASAQERQTDVESAKATPKPRGPSEVTAKDIEDWYADAENKLVAGYKKEARAMYAKIVERDPTNKFGKSDIAFIKMVALMVDREDDQLRRTAYVKIREFLKRFPDSPYKDYYTVVRSILAADLGDYAEAHALLDRFPEEFPNSRYQDLARSVWEELPKDIKSLRKRPDPTSTSRVAAATRNTKSGATASSSAKKQSSATSAKSGSTKSSASSVSSASKSTSSRKESSGGASTKSSTNKSKSSTSSKSKSSSSVSRSNE
ncbi:MAG: thioredoxin family protein [Candidatus Sumerlaeaceae bacterium]